DPRPPMKADLIPRRGGSVPGRPAQTGSLAPVRPGRSGGVSFGHPSSPDLTCMQGWGVDSVA
ncbi:MAG: hypothetical protein ACPGNT_11235, partial [Rhodospirillales bacterium]